MSELVNGELMLTKEEKEALWGNLAQSDKNPIVSDTLLTDTLSDLPITNKNQMDAAMDIRSKTNIKADTSDLGKGGDSSVQTQKPNMTVQNQPNPADSQFDVLGPAKEVISTLAPVVLGAGGVTAGQAGNALASTEGANIAGAVQNVAPDITDTIVNQANQLPEGVEAPKWWQVFKQMKDLFSGGDPSKLSTSYTDKDGNLVGVPGSAGNFSQFMESPAGMRWFSDLAQIFTKGMGENHWSNLAAQTLGDYAKNASTSNVQNIEPISQAVPDPKGVVDEKVGNQTDGLEDKSAIESGSNLESHLDKDLRVQPSKAKKKGE